MGSQVNFYMTAADEQQFVEFLRSQDGVHILQDWTPTPKPLELDKLPERGTDCWFQVWLWNSTISSPPKLHYVKEQKHYCMTPETDEVVEFDRSIFHGRKLGRGRLYAHLTGWDVKDPAVIIRKSDAFRKWFNRLTGWIKRRSRRNEMGDYLMPGAAEFAEQGGKIVQMVFANGSAIDG